MQTQLTRQLGSHAKNVQIHIDQTIVIPRDSLPTEDPPLPVEKPTWLKLLFLAGIFIMLAGVAWLVPTQAQTIWLSIIQQLFQVAQ